MLEVYELRALSLNLKARVEWFQPLPPHLAVSSQSRGLPPKSPTPPAKGFELFALRPWVSRRLVNESLVYGHKYAVSEARMSVSFGAVLD